MCPACVDCELVKTHSIRGAAVSKAKINSVPISQNFENRRLVKYQDLASFIINLFNHKMFFLRLFGSVKYV